jgi:hypothetical protein
MNLKPFHMKTRFLFPNYFKTIGWVIFIPSVLLVILSHIFEFQFDEYLNVKVFAIYNDDFFKTGSDSSFFKFIKNNFVNSLFFILLHRKCMIIL